MSMLSIRAVLRLKSSTNLVCLTRTRFYQSVSQAQSITPEKTTWQPLNFGSSNKPESQRISESAPDLLDPSKSCTPPYDAEQIAMDKRKRIEAKKWTRKRQKIANAVANPRELEGSNEEVLIFEVEDLLKQAASNKAQRTSNIHHPSTEIVDYRPDTVPAPFIPEDAIQKAIELEVVMLSSTGDGLAYTPNKDHVIVVPFCVPGDRVLAMPYKTVGPYTHADLVEILSPSPKREDVVPPCKYFARCSGCQFQMLPYSAQLEHKRDIVRRAFQKFSRLQPGQIPEVEPTMGSPLQYGYRTKITPHFDGPKDWRKGIKQHLTEQPDMGFNEKGRRRVLDIENCPIATEIVQEGLKRERKRVADEWPEYVNGKTVMVRESTERQLLGEPSNGGDPEEALRELTFNPAAKPEKKELIINPDTKMPVLELSYPSYKDRKTYISDERAQATEYVTVSVLEPPNEETQSSAGPAVTTSSSGTQPKPVKTMTYTFSNIAGSFFQNNNSILHPFTSYIYHHCLPSSASTSQPQIKYLLDAYTGSGLFAHVLSPLFSSTLGIDVDARAIASARRNASLNALHTKLGFIDATAEHLFADVPFPPQESLCVIDPPRKGCSMEFLRQLRRFGVGRVVYVSCNVHSQARDVGILVNGEPNEESGEEKLWKYEIETIKGFDFFPQTGHVEGVCILNRVEE